MISLKSRVVTPLSDNKFSNDYLSSSTSSPFSNRLYFTGVGQRPSTPSSLYSKGRLLASSSVERLNRSESPPPAFRGGSSWDLRSSSPMRRPRHPSVDRFRRTDHHPSYRSISRDELSSIDLSASPGNSLQTSSIMERRNMIISNFNRSLPPSGLAPTSLISHHPHHNLHPRSNFAASRNNLTNLTNSSATRPWPSAGLDVFRPRIRDRPSLASIKSSIKSRIKPSDSSSRYSKAAPVSSDASLRLSRYRHVIKFREFHIDEPINKRKASISWDLPLEPISSSSSYNSKSSQNDSSAGSHSSTSRQSSVEKESKIQTMTKPDTNDAKNEKNELTSTSFPQSSIHRQNSVSRSRSSQKSSHQTPKIKVPKLEITPVSVMNQTSPDVIELPKPLPKGRTKPSSDKDRPSGKPIYHHRKPSSPDPSCISPIPGESPTSSRLPSPSPSLILSIEEKSRKILSKSGSTSPVPMSSNKLLSANSNETGAINSASTSPSSSVSSRSVVNPRQELKLSIVNDSSSSGIKFSENLSSTHSSPPSSVSSRVPGTTTKTTSLSSSSSSPSPSVTEAKCKGLKLSKEMEETKKRSLTPSRPNNRSSSPSLPLTSNSSPLTPPNSNQVNSERSESSRVDSSDKINPSPPVPTNHSPMPKSSVDKVKGSLNLPAAPKSSSVSPKPSANSSSNKVTKNTLTSKSSSCPPTPTENYPSYVVKTKNSSTAKSSEKQLQEKLISKNSGKSKAPAKSSPESSSTPSSPQVLQGASPATSPILLELNKKSKTKSSESLKQQKQQSTKLSSSDKKGKPEKSVESEEVKQPSVVEPINQAMSASSDKQNSETIKGKESFEPLDGKFNTANKQASVKEKNENDAKRNSSAKTPSVKSSPTSSTKQTVQDANDLKTAEIPQIQSSQVKTERMSSKLKTDKMESKEGINKKGEDKVNTEKEIKVEKEDTKKDHKDGKSETQVDENVTRKESSEKINAADEKEVTQTNKHQNNTKDGDRINGLNKFLVNGNLEEPSIIENKKERKRIRFRPYTMDDFELRKVLGRGSFGKVYLAQLKGHDVFFAIKFLKKHVVIEDDDLESIMVERKVLALGVRHPFICKLFCTFQTRGMVCFVMEFLAGGDLMFHVQSSGRFTEDRSRFYAAEIVSALNFLHSRYIIYRDLKLDNILLDAEGHVRLVDFGMCQCHIWKEECLPSNFCGTPEYMAPEIIKGVQYNQAVDWWSFGVLLYEMIVGDSPFKATDEDELLWNVCYEKVRIPYFVSKNAQSIILSLLEYDPAERLGMPTSSKGDIRSHKFFESINWDAINAAKVKPPFVPNLKNQFDTCYFDREFTEMRPVLTPIDDYTVENVDHELFFGFDYTNPNMTD
ncbi:flippase kinase 1 isoform X2 [Tetranychus urticae]|nr:flippase kinase 1 isoform X2 [Tetranychus urticae]